MTTPAIVVAKPTKHTNKYGKSDKSPIVQLSKRINSVWIDVYCGTKKEANPKTKTTNPIMERLIPVNSMTRFFNIIIRVVNHRVV